MRTAVATSSASRQRAITAGRRSIMPFQTLRAASYSGWSGVMTSPARRSESAAATAERSEVGWMAMGRISWERKGRCAEPILPAVRKATVNAP